MIANWFKIKKKEELSEETLSTYEGYSRGGIGSSGICNVEEISIRDFVKKIVEKIKDKSFDCIREVGDPYYSLHFEQITISRWGSKITLYVFGKHIPLNSCEEEEIFNCSSVRISEAIKIKLENDRIEKEAEIKAAEDYFK